MKINWHHKSIDHYIGMMHRGERFAFAGYSDAEMFSMIGHHIGHPTSLGQTLDANAGAMLLDIIRRRHRDNRFMFAVPDCMWKLDNFTADGLQLDMESTIAATGVKEIDFHERDMVTDDLARDAGLFPLIQEIRNHRVVLVGNKFLRDVYFFRHEFVEVSCPNQHLDLDGLSRVVAQCRELGKEKTLFIVSAGISAALIIDQLYDQCPDSSFFDCGSMWDAFVGIGGQREWRRQLYMHPHKLIAWRRKNLHGE